MPRSTLAMPASEEPPALPPAEPPALPPAEPPALPPAEPPALPPAEPPALPPAEPPALPPAVPLPPAVLPPAVPLPPPVMPPGSPSTHFESWQVNVLPAVSYFLQSNLSTHSPPQPLSATTAGIAIAQIAANLTTVRPCFRDIY